MAICADILHPYLSFPLFLLEQTVIFGCHAQTAKIKKVWDDCSIVKRLILKSPYECSNKARKLVEKYLEGKMSPKLFVWDLSEIRMVGLTETMFERMLSGFKGHPKIEEIRAIVEEYDVFGAFKGTKKD